MKKNPISTRRIFPSSQVPPSSVISYGVFLLVFIILISFMLFRTSSQQENLINMNSRLIDLEQQVQQSVQSSEVTVETLSDDLKEVNREIRKLWDLSNKRNKQRIATLEDQLNSIDSSIKEIFTQSQEIRLISKEFSKSISDIKTRVAKIDASTLSSPDYELRIKDLEEAVKSMDSFRRQTNQSILKLKEELSNCPVIPTRWRLTIEARIHNLTGDLESAHETLNKLYAFLGNDSTLLRTTCSYYEKVRDIGCLLYLLEKIKTIAVHKKYATNRLLIYKSDSAPIERLIELTSDLCSMEENNKDLKQTLLYYKFLDPTLSASSKSFDKLLLEAKNFKKILGNPQSRITLALAFLRKGSPGSALLELGEDHNWSEWQYERPGWFWIALKTFELNSIDSSLGQTSLLNSTISRAERECFVAVFGPN